MEAQNHPQKPKEDHYQLETMPVPPFVEGRPRTLIIGTFPPAKDRWDYDFFFPNKQNRLWNTLARVRCGDASYHLPDLPKPMDEVEVRKQILRALDAAMVNIIHQCRRKNGSALDNDLAVEQMEDIVDGILRFQPTISRIFLTSESGRNSCLSLLKRHLREKAIPIHRGGAAKKTRTEKIMDPMVLSFAIDEREIRVYSLYSPSPTAMRAGITEQNLFQQYMFITK